MNKTKEVHYIFDLQGKVLEEIDVTNSQIISSVFLKSRYLARVSGDETLFYGLDHQGTTVLVTDETGEAVWSAESSPFGDHVMGGIKIREDLKLKYTGKDYDEDTDLYYFNARWYDASTGRFITEDPARDGQNWYSYVRNNPLKFIDPTGLYTDEKSKGSGDDYEYAQSSAGKEEMKEKEREHKKKKEIEKNIKELEDLESKAEILLDRIRVSLKRQQIKNRLAALAASGSETAKDWIRANTEINIIRDQYKVYDNQQKLWDGKLSLDFMGASLDTFRVQTWADHDILRSNDGTLRPGAYDGELLGETPSFENAIRILKDFFIHPNQLKSATTPYRGGLLLRSQGCIVMHAGDFNKMKNLMSDMSFDFSKRQKVNVNIGLNSRNYRIPIKNEHYYGTQGVNNYAP